MRPLNTILLATLAFLSVAPTHSTAQSEIAPGLFDYDVPQLQRVNRAVQILEASGADLDDYDVVLYSTENPEFYLITFTTSVVFAEDGPVRAEDVRMLFNAETEALIAVEADPPPGPPQQD